MNDRHPLITVAMPIYNAGPDLRLAVMSIIGQTCTDWELLIVDDGSTDHALEAIQDILAADDRIRVLSDGQNKGLAARLNECIDLARGTYFARMDQDDVSYPERFAKQLQALQLDAALEMVSVRAIYIDEHDVFFGIVPYRQSHAAICARPWLGFYLPHPTWMGHVAWFRRFRYAQPAPYLCEDQELLLRSYEASCFGTVDEILFAYRKRRVIPAEKLRKTQLSVLGMQWRHFVAHGQYRFVILAVLALAGRLLRDAVNRAQPQKMTADAELIERWGNVLAECRQKYGAGTCKGNFA